MLLRIGLAATLFALTTSASAQPRTVDYRYAPAYWYTGIGLVDDWQKTLVDDRGRLLYDFGPGPYVRPKTTVSVGLKGVELEPVRQTMPNAPLPFIQTEFRAGDVTMTQEVFAAIPDADPPSTSPARFERLEGHVGTMGWADPPEGTSPMFRSVAWGANRPVRYRLQVEPGSTWQVAFGMAEGHRTRPGQRQLELVAEGADPLFFDPIESGERNEPQVIVIEGSDADRDGWLHVGVNSAEGDPNTYMNVLWLFAPDASIDESALIRGDLNAEAELVIDGGQEMAEGHAARIDILTARISPNQTPVVEIVTGRIVSAHAEGADAEGKPFVRTSPAPIRSEATETGWRLELPKGTQEATVYVMHGASSSVSLPNVADAKHRTEWYWQEEAPTPDSRIRVPDEELQDLMDISLRTIYQSREVTDGRIQFQPGMGLYRGLWVHDSAYFIDTALMLGDTTAARDALEGILEFQQSNGRIRVNRPHTMNRETALTVWMMTRYARLTDDDAWFRARWPDVQRAVNWIRDLRAQTLDDPSSPTYGLLPPGFADGGLGGVNAEYSGVFWMLTSLEAVVQTAERLGYTEDASSWRSLFNDALASWRAAAARDQTTDEHGNVYLPAVVGPTELEIPSQRAQWMLGEALINGSYLSPQDPLVQSTLAMLEASEIDGLVPNVGWLEDGIWAYFGAWYSLMQMEVGNRDKAADALYAFANHASPLGAWAEEQMPKGAGPRTAGDFPHAWGSSLLLRNVRLLIAREHGDDLLLLDGVPADWLTPSDTLQLDGIQTLFGELAMTASVDAFGRTATLEVSPIGDAGQAGAIRVNLRALRQLGYVADDGSALPDELTIPWGEQSVIEMRRP
ncbi:MAG: hypothetical protein Rubg2KO_21040 [Rubricoccaceae bacterium]